MRQAHFILIIFLFLFAGCGPKDITNSIAISLSKKSANNLSLVEYGYNENNKYLNQDIGNLNLKRATGNYKIDADDVVMFFHNIPKKCRFIGYITIENPNGLKFPRLGSNGLKIFNFGSIGDFDTESYLLKYLKKASAVNGVKYISYKTVYFPKKN